MGKLADLKEQRNEMDWEHPDRLKVEGEINRIEQWCIDNNKGYVKKLTTWYKGQKKWRPFSMGYDERFEDPVYPWHVGCLWVEDQWMVEKNLNRDGTPHNCPKCS